jgi:hypothetical protein|tara:strand:+ start:109 stop:459 length:351 start_codon:yes stop_codon:yes gene_type:complete
MLGTFQKTVLIVALVILVLGLIIVAIMLLASASDAKWPPYSGTCPDYWNLENIPGTNGGEKCVNKFKLGLGKSQSNCKNFVPQSGSGSGCTKFNYANSCQVTWDGITNSNKLRKNC